MSIFLTNNEERRNMTKAKDNAEEATASKDNMSTTRVENKPNHYQTQFANTLSMFDPQPRVGYIPVCGARGRETTAVKPN